MHTPQSENSSLTWPEVSPAPGYGSFHIQTVPKQCVYEYTHTH